MNPKASLRPLTGSRFGTQSGSGRGEEDDVGLCIRNMKTSGEHLTLYLVGTWHESWISSSVWTCLSPFGTCSVKSL